MDIFEYEEKFINLINIEKKEQINFHKNEILKFEGYIREKKGRCLFKVNGVEIKNRNFSTRIKYSKPNNNLLYNNEFKIGDIVIVNKFDEDKNKIIETKVKGTIVEINRYNIICEFPKIQGNIIGNNLRVDLYSDDITFERQINAIKNLKKFSFEQRELREVILGNKKPKLYKKGEFEPIKKYFNKNLNESQKLAVNYSVREKNIFLVQGPPGTGKTQTCKEIILQHIERKHKILVVADSNVAVDNLMERLSDSVDVIRFGYSTKISPIIEKNLLQNKINNDILGVRLREIMRKVDEYKLEQQKYSYPSQNKRKGLSDLQIMKLAERNDTYPGINKNDLKDMAMWIKFQNKIKKLRRDYDKIRKEVERKIINNAQVICATNTGSWDERIPKVDLVLIDEAGQSTEPSCLIPISKAKKVILVGDHKQLPPTILSKSAKELSKSLFERLFDKCRYVVLDLQYRMNEKIMKFSSDEFYKGLLKADDSCKNVTFKNNKFKSPILFFDIKGEEIRKKGSMSIYNIMEAEKVFDVLEEIGLDCKENIGIISPYMDQVIYINKKIKESKYNNINIEVHTVDGFQGREKDIIIISFVRSNDKGNMGFLEDLRRLNVAITRAKKLVVMIGNKQLLQTNNTYRRLIEYVEKEMNK